MYDFLEGGKRGQEKKPCSIHVGDDQLTIFVIYLANKSCKRGCGSWYCIKRKATYTYINFMVHVQITKLHIHICRSGRMFSNNFRYCFQIWCVIFISVFFFFPPLVRRYFQSGEGAGFQDGTFRFYPATYPQVLPQLYPCHQVSLNWVLPVQAQISLLRFLEWESRLCLDKRKSYGRVTLQR